MKKIQPVKVWYNGQEQDATLLNVFASSDNLINSADFTYYLLKESENVTTNNVDSILASGNLKMTGEDYDNWQTNEYAYNWVANQLNIVILD